MIFRAVRLFERVAARLLLYSVLEQYEAYEGARREMFSITNCRISKDHDTF
jgi:hypothetical protein